MSVTDRFLYDSHRTRYQLVKSSSGAMIFNWLFIPGGPGADSIYFIDLVNKLDLPGNCWLIDFPENGSNVSNSIADYDFEKWAECLLSVVHAFENPIIVGHSFGGMFPLMFPQLENVLKGFVILNSAPSLWMEEAAKQAKENNIPLLIEPMAEFEHNPSQETFKKALMACAPYYFTKEKLEAGKALLEKIPFNYHAAVWWLQKANKINFNAQWIPERVNTLILGASNDFITPFSLFEKDRRFSRENILLKKLPDAGHFPWLEQMSSVRSIFNDFANVLLKTAYTTSSSCVK